MSQQPCPSREYFDLYRTVVRHQWSAVEEWVRNLDELSDLSDAEIEDLARLAANDDSRTDG